MSYIGNQPTSVAFPSQNFSGNGSTTAFTMSVAPANTASVFVYVSGVKQDPTTYSVSGTTLTFSAAPPSGTNNISVIYMGVPASGVTTTAYRTITEFTATAGQTSFSVPSYTVGYMDVFRNGVRLNSADFTASTGTTVVLTSGATAGDTVTTESFYVSSVVGAIPATNGAVTSAYLLDGGVTQAKLAAGVAGNGPAFSAYQSSAQTLSASTWTKVTFTTEEFDTNNNFASSTFTPTVAGYYQINVAVTYNTASSIGGANALRLYKNGSAFKYLSSITLNSGALYGGDFTTLASSALIYFNGSSDYVECYVYSSSTPTLTATSSGTYFQGFLARSA